eukprot:GFUD01010790.1.p1 GENE.GFUD01010790.1~~GFUD01010790.1.p1  ORF type:complete len:468 (+),score=77.12 GFUD01010790.1:189-1592(+)
MELIIYGTFLVLSLVAYAARQVANKGDEKKVSISNINFKSFQKSFFLVYFLALLGDWLQGPYVYKLYAFYGFKESEIAVLYVAGFASSVVFGTCTGPLADLWGRKKMAIAFSVIYTFCCLTKMSPNFWWLFIGRVFGGVATSMLFSTFESWYVYEHSERHGFPSEWIGITFSITTFWNGMIAIFAGIISNVTAETLGFGPVAPFVVALLPLVVCGVLVVNTWEENYGDRKSNFSGSCWEGLKIIFSDEQVLLLGSVQSLLESCMYIFVFLWTPVLDTGTTPLGMVFSCFMVCIMVGSALFSIMANRGYTEANILKHCLIMISVSMAICCYTARPGATNIDTVISFLAFLVLEVAIGMYFPAISYLRSQVIPESHRANVMNWFRVPMNVITCGALLCLHVETISNDKRIVFGACLVLSLLGTFLCNRFILAFRDENASKKGGIDIENDVKSGLLDDVIKHPKLEEVGE